MQKNGDGERLQTGPGIPVETLEAALRSNALVRDARVLVRRDPEGNEGVVCYVVASQQVRPSLLRSELRAHLARTFPSFELPCSVISISCLPLREDGLVADELLLPLEVLDEGLVQRTERALQARTDVERSAVVVQEQRSRRRPLHLADVLPDRSVVAVDRHESSSASSSAEAEDSGTASDPSPRVALSDGGPLVIAPSAPRTFIEALLRTAERAPGKGLTYVQPDGSVRTQTFPELLQEARSVLTGLRALGLKPGDAVILQVRSHRDYFPAFWGCVLGGVIPVTVAVPPSYDADNGTVRKLLSIWELLGKPLVLASDALLDQARRLERIAGEPLRLAAVEPLRAHTPAQELYSARPEDVVFYQLTSGSTGISKCIEETHRGVIAHVHGSAQFNGYTPDDVTLNWLPMDHVVPILTCHLKDTYLGCQQITVPTASVLGDPLLWLDLIERYRATHTWAPNFGFKLVADALAKVEGRRWDLSSVKFFMNAGEQVTLPVVRSFLTRVAPFGVQEKAMQPSFGMAEACTCMTYQNDFSLQGGVYFVKKSSLGGRLKLASFGAKDCVEFIDLGPPMPGVQIRITDSQNRLVPEGVIGRFQIKGNVITPGYYRNPPANQEAFVGEEWFNSGDLGFILDGRLTLTGREKEMIIVNGANFYCYEIEDVVNAIPGVEPTFSAACGVSDPSKGTEGLVVFFVPEASVASDDMAAVTPLVSVIRTRVASSLGISPAFVIPLPMVDFSKTTSGKIQRSAMKKKLLEGGFDEVLKKMDVYLENVHTIPDWFFQGTWCRKEIEPVDAARTGHALVLLDRQNLGAQVAELLGAQGRAVVTVEPGPAYERLGENRFRAALDSEEDYRRLFERLRADRTVVSEVLHFQAYEAQEAPASVEALRESQRGPLAIATLLRALRAIQGTAQPVLLLVVASGTQAPGDGDSIAYSKSTLPGMLRTLGQELPWLRTRLVDVPVPGREDAGVTAELVARESQLLSSEEVVAYRDLKRLVPRLERVAFPLTRSEPLPFRKNGLHLLTGGLGGIGSVVAQMLAEQYQSRLLLVGRTPLPPEDGWAALLSDPARGRDPAAARVSAMLALRRAGADVRYAALDVTDTAALGELVARAEREWGVPLDGVIHLAGVFTERPMLEESLETFWASLAPKVAGTWALQQLLETRPGASFIHFSSVIGVFGGANVGAYAAANSFQEGFAKSRGLAGAGKHYCLNWSMWDELGMSRGYPMKELFLARGNHLIRPDQGRAAWVAALGRGPGQTLIGIDSSRPFVRRYIVDSPQNAEKLVGFFKGRCSVTEGPGAPGGQPPLVVADLFNTSVNCELTRLELLPQSADGAVDRAALESMRAKRSAERTLPQDELETQLERLYASMLGVPQVDTRESFFELGGDSLIAAQLVVGVQRELGWNVPLSQLMATPSVAGLAGFLREQQAPTTDAPARVVQHDDAGRHEPFALTHMQQAYWVGRRGVFELGNVSLHWYLEVSCPALDLTRFTHACRTLIARHDALRTVFLPTGEQQVLREVPSFSLTVEDGRAESAQTLEARGAAVREELSHQVRDLEQWPLFDICAHLLPDGTTRLHLSVDLTILDSRSCQILARELLDLYAGKQGAASEPRIQFRDYVLAAQGLEGTSAHQRSLEYWRERLKQLPAGPDLPLLQNPGSINPQRMEGRTAHLDLEAWGSLKARASSAGLTPAVVFLTAFTDVLGRWSRTPRFTVNVPLFNRKPLHPDVNQLLGNFASFTLLEVDQTTQETFLTRAQRIQKQLLEGVEHSHVSGVEILRERYQAQGQVSGGAIPVVFTNLPSGIDAWDTSLRREFREQVGEVTFTTAQTPQVWMDNIVSYEDDGVRFHLEAVQGLFPVGMIQSLFGAFVGLVRQLSAGDEAWTQRHHDLLPADQRERRERVNGSVKEVPSVLLQELFAARADEQPNAPALMTPERTLSYGELAAETNRLGHYLRAHGARPNELVAVVMEKGWEQVVAVMGILNAGAAYLPVDCELPAERLEYLLRNAEVRQVLTQSRVLPSLSLPPGVQTLCVDSPELASFPAHRLDTVQGPDDLAFVIYTSGSTGLPKGAMIAHRGVVNAILETNQTYRITALDKVLALTALHHDMSAFDIFGMLAAGGSLVIPRATHRRDPAHWAELMRSERVTLWNSVPAMMEMLLEHVAGGPDFVIPSLRWAFMGGDWLSLTAPERLRRHAPQSTVVSVGGPTETTLWNIWYPVESVNPSWRSIPYGKPIANTRYEVLSTNLEPCPDWVPGELCCEGVGVAKGYWRDEARTREKFINHPVTGRRLYRTGDLGRYLPDGNLEFLGRTDFQLKVQGQRIEPGEIEAALVAHPAIKAAIITAAGELHNRKLVAHLVAAAGSDASGDLLREHLARKLPSHMVPAAFIVWDAFPLTGNGKVDRRKLEERAASEGNAALQVDAVSAPPQSELEQKLCQMLCDLLQVTAVSTEQSFFALGATSLHLVRLHRNVVEQLGRTISVTDLFRFRSVRTLSEHLGKGDAAPAEDFSASSERARQQRAAAARRRDLRRS